MTVDVLLVFSILFGAVCLFVLDRFPIDLVALLILAVLIATALISPTEGVSGFSNPATVTVGCMFVLSGGLQSTGALKWVGQWLRVIGTSTNRLLLGIMVSIGVISAFVNNTAALAVFLPLVLGAAHARKIPSSKLLIPLSYAAQFGGVATLIGSSTNLLVSSISEDAGVGAFSMFEFAPLGLIMFAAGLIYILFIGQFLLPARRGGELTDAYQLRDYITELRVLPGSPCIGKTFLELNYKGEGAVNVLELIRADQRIFYPRAETLQADDVLIVRGNVNVLMDFRTQFKLVLNPEFELTDTLLAKDKLILMEALVAPSSRFIGETVITLDLFRYHRVILLGVQRHGQILRRELSKMRFEFGDALLLLGEKENLQRMEHLHNILALGELEDKWSFPQRAPIALGIMFTVVALAATGALSIVGAALLGCVAMVFSRCLKAEELYDSIDWRVIMLLAGILPLGLALERTGAARLIVDQGLLWVGHTDPRVLLGLVYISTAILTECMSNNAAAVLLAPIAISVALSLGLDPKPFLMAVTFAASTSFATPVGYQTNTMVYNAGSYRFTDFLRVGVPLNIIFAVLAIYFIPIFWPF